MRNAKEGDLYGVVRIYGKTFEIYYGYYEEIDRFSKYPQPIEVFPDFIKEPLYTDDGTPFVTAIQMTCEHYEKVRDTADKCADCLYFEKGEELFASSHPNHAEGVYIINSEGIAYHQHGVLYIIKPQEDARWRVMRYTALP